MKKIALLFCAVLLFSCGRSKEEQMFYDFMDSTTIKSIQMSIKDLDFQIIKIKEDGVLIAKDSIDILTSNVAELQKNLEGDRIYIEERLQEIKKYELEKSKSFYPEIKKALEKIIDLTQEQIDDKKEYSDKRQLSLDKISLRLNQLNIDVNQVISNRYHVIYSMLMPDTDIIYTFKGFAYSNENNSKFIRVVQ